MSNNVEEKILHGTTTVGIKAKDGVVLCADMRASAGYFIANNNTMKIQKIDAHAGLTLAGGVADAQNIVDILRYHSNLHRVEKQGPISIHSLARLCSLIFHQIVVIHLWLIFSLVVMMQMALHYLTSTCLVQSNKNLMLQQVVALL